ncbi:MAG: FAD-dependent monooxygenase, partial [Bacillota bacterium]
MYDVAIVGAGPAGASAATFTARAGLKTLLLDADQSMTRRA